MPNRTLYRQAAGRLLGPFLTGTATSGSTTGVLACTAWPYKTGIDSDERFEHYHLYRPNALTATDAVRTVSTYDSANGELSVDQPYAIAPYVVTGEAFKLLGVVDPDEVNRFVNESLKLCDVMVDVTFQTAAVADVRHSLASAAPWLTEAERVLQVGYLTSSEDIDEVNPYYCRGFRGEAIKENGIVYLTGFSHNVDDTIYVKVARPAYTYCKVSAGSYGGLTAGLTAETDEAVPQTEWVAAGVQMLAWDELRDLFWPGNQEIAEREVARASSRFWALARQYGQRPQRTFVKLRHWGPRYGYTSIGRTGWLV